MRARWGDYFEATRAIVPWGALVSAADFVQAQRVRRVGQRMLAALYAEVDLIVTPTATMTAPTYDDVFAGGVLDILRRIFTAYWDAVGNPVLAVPVGFAANGLPCSMQIAGRPFEEATVLRAGDAYQRATDWHLAVPTYAADGATK
jgi:aspartyl-tRNA(Asn)/glutamyl-tRNA(Gln) amidotransferase subunit A